MNEEKKPISIDEFRFSVGEIAKILGFKNGTSLCNARKEPYVSLCKDYIEEIPASYASGKPSKKSVSHKKFNEWMWKNNYTVSDKGCNHMETIYNEYCKWFKIKYQTPTLEDLNNKIAKQEEMITDLYKHLYLVTSELVNLKRNLKMH